MIITPPSTFASIIPMVFDFLTGLFQYGIVPFFFLLLVGMLIRTLLNALNFRI